MIKIIIVLLVFAFGISGCKISPPADDRLELISGFIEAAESYDTAKLFDLIDTSAYFRVQNREQLLFLLDFVAQNIDKCDIKASLHNLHIHDEDPYSKRYAVPFCRAANGIITEESFDIDFLFRDYESNGKIHFISLEHAFYGNQPAKAAPTKK